MARLPVLLREQEHRLPEQGRIKFGIKGAKAPKAITTLRFTSTDRGPLDQLAAAYGGKVAGWENGYGRAAFELISNTDRVRVVLPPDPWTQWYEQWEGRTASRRCDGKTCTLPRGRRGQGGMGLDEEQVPCICRAQGGLECKPVTRLNLVIPELVPFRGVWRAEAKGEHARLELPGMCDAVATAQGRGMAYGWLILERRSEYGISAKTGLRELHHYVTPIVTPSSSFDQLLEGASRARSLGSGSSYPALGQGQQIPVVPEEVVELEPEDVVEAEWFEEPAAPAPTADIEDADVVEPIAEADASAGSIGDDSPPASEEWEDPDARDTTAKAVEDKRLKNMRTDVARMMPDADLRHELVRRLTKGRTSTSTELSYDELRLLQRTVAKVIGGALPYEEAFT